MSKPFEEHMPEVLDSLTTDPDGLYQVTYRVGDVIVSAHIWRDSQWQKPANQELSEFDLEFLREIRVVLDGSSEEHATP